MNARNTVALILSLCLAVGAGGCRQQHRGGLSAAEPGKAQTSEPRWTVGWAQLENDMDAVEVLSLLDEPWHVKVTKINTTWFYSDRRAEGPHVVFDTRRMRVDRWRAPQNR